MTDRQPTAEQPAEGGSDPLKLDLLEAIRPILKSGAEAGVIEEAKGANRVMPPRFHTQPDSIVSHHITQEDLTRIKMAAQIPSDSAVFQFSSGALTGLIAPCALTIWKATKPAGIGGLEAIDVISFVLAIGAVCSIATILVGRAKNKRQTVDDICKEIEHRKQHPDHQ